MANGQGRVLARTLGLFSLGLGVVQLVAPHRFSESIGVKPKRERPLLVRLVGAREILAAIGLLSSRRPAPWLWLRVGGDLMDLALLGRAMTARDTDTERVSGALAGTVGVTALDVISSLEATTNGDGRTAEEAEGRRGRLIRKGITIKRSPDEVYGYWRQLQNLPRFMQHLEEVREIDERRSHWVAKAPAGSRVEWDAEITDEQPGRSISWRALPESPVKHEGTVRFEPAPGDRGTEVHVEMLYEPPLGVLGVAIAKLSGEEPDQQVYDDLRRFKQVMEVGHVVQSEAVVGGRRLRQRPAQPPPREQLEQPVNV